jgi:Na+-translocating ferredoxin:NAD+ oxidoreductase subunit C
MTRILHKFPGGLHLPDNKAMSQQGEISPGPLPKRLIIPLQQHIGAPAKPVVKVGDKVLKGQILARPEGYVSAPVHASSSGTVVAIEALPVPHPSGQSAPCIVIETDGEDRRLELACYPDYENLDESELRNIIRDAGIVGLGGAGFPSFIKLNPGARTELETLILNGAECEPYITCDDMLMRERAEEVIIGARIMRFALHARQCLIGVEDNKPEAIAALREVLHHLDDKEIEVVEVPTLYPTGGEKQLIKILTGKEVPSQGLPIDVNIVCHNVATAASVYRAVDRGEPLISRIVTITGHGAAHPKNMEVLIGTPVGEVIKAAGGDNGVPYTLLMGGPMMGIELQNEEIPSTKTANCLLLATQKDMPERGPVRSCIRCGECTTVCPMRLMPQQLYWHARARDFDKIQDFNLFDCIECGCCAYVCPSNLPLVHYYRFAKNEIWAQERERKAADKARERHEFRQFRIEREKEEKAARHKAKSKPAQGGDAEKQAAIKAAMERAKAKREAAAVEPKNTKNLTAAQQRQVDDADARRQAMPSAEKEEN